ncbi:MAG: hypothetical protein J07HR59_01719 [Halorubrum sp. J07HR59]|nr:MAG: hypothetical protein J07HR59_01719 [Halorubrum sp. J07HR59]
MVDRSRYQPSTRWTELEAVGLSRPTPSLKYFGVKLRAICPAASVEVLVDLATSIVENGTSHFGGV